MMKKDTQHPLRASGFSGRTVGNMLKAANRRSKPSTEHRKMRIKNQLKPMGKNRFPNGKYDLQK